MADLPVFVLATPADIPLIQGLARRIWHAVYPAIISCEQIEYMLAKMYSHEAIGASIAAGTFWEIIRCGEVACGYFALRTASGEAAELDKLYLLPEFHGRGFGQAALARVRNLAEARGCRSVQLRVNKRNERALRAYGRAGFIQVGAPIAEIGGGFVMDDYLLELRLSTTGSFGEPSPAKAP